MGRMIAYEDVEVVAEVSCIYWRLVPSVSFSLSPFKPNRAFRPPPPRLLRNLQHLGHNLPMLCQQFLPTDDVVMRRLRLVVRVPDAGLVLAQGIQIPEPPLYDTSVEVGAFWTRSLAMGTFRMRLLIPIEPSFYGISVSRNPTNNIDIC